MNYKQIKKQANEILRNMAAECSYIEYKASEQQLDKILKTICAYGNNYYNNDIQYLFIGVEEENSEDNKAIPILPIKGIPEGHLEKSKNVLNSLRAFLYPNVSFEVLANELERKYYLLVVVMCQTRISLNSHISTGFKFYFLILFGFFPNHKRPTCLAHNDHKQVIFSLQFIHDYFK